MPNGLLPRRSARIWTAIMSASSVAGLGASRRQGLRRLLPLLMLAAACGSSTTGGIPDPFVIVDFPGTWQVRDLVRTDGGGDVPTDPGAAHQPFRPLHEGALLQFFGGHLVGDDGQPLFEQWHAGVANTRYTNLTSRADAFFDFASQGADGCTWHEEVTASFHAITATELVCTAVIVSSSDCSDPAPLAAEAVGAFRFRLVQVALPAQVSPMQSSAATSGR